MTPIDDADTALAWAGADLATIRARWADRGPAAEVLALTGETRIPPRLEHATLEALRVARADVHHLIAIIDRANRADTAPTDHAAPEPSYWFAEGYSRGAYGTPEPAGIEHLNPTDAADYDRGIETGHAALNACHVGPDQHDQA